MPGKFPVIMTTRVILRQMGEDYKDEIFKHFSNEEIHKYVDFEPAHSMDDAIEIIKWGQMLFDKNSGCLFGIYLKNGEFIGQCNYVMRKTDNFTGDIHRAEIGFDLALEYWGNGYMNESLRGMIDHVFTDTGITRLEAITHVENTRAHKTLKRIDFKEEGTLRGYIIWKGQAWDMKLFSLLKSEFDV